VLDKGIVIDAWVRVSLVGIELVTVEARVVVASIATYLGYSDVLSDLKQTGIAQTGYPVNTVGKNFPTWSAV
jgi:gas vesicle structural protein